MAVEVLSHLLDTSDLKRKNWSFSTVISVIVTHNMEGILKFMLVNQQLSQLVGLNSIVSQLFGRSVSQQDSYSVSRCDS